IFTRVRRWLTDMNVLGCGLQDVSLRNPVHPGLNTAKSAQNKAEQSTREEASCLPGRLKRLAPAMCPAARIRPGKRHPPDKVRSVAPSWPPYAGLLTRIPPRSSPAAVFRTPR